MPPTLIAEGKRRPCGPLLLLGITKRRWPRIQFLSGRPVPGDDEGAHRRRDPRARSTTWLATQGENVIIGVPIPAGTGLSRYREVGLTYKGSSEFAAAGGGRDAARLPRREALRDIEGCCPSRRIGRSTATATSTWARTTVATRSGLRWTIAARSCPTRTARLYIYDDLGVSQRWANKFLRGGHRDGGRPRGPHRGGPAAHRGALGVKAIEELKEGLEAHDLTRT